MKVLHFLFLCVFTNFLFSQEAVEIEKFGKNPGNLKMFVYNPTPSDVTKKPLLVVLHGCTQDAKEVAELTGWNKLATLHNFVVIYPQQRFINNPNYCYNWFLKNDVEKGKGECESIYEMIQFAQSNYNIDTRKIHITGLSSGACMTMAMLATHPETFQNAAVFSGGGYKIGLGLFEGIQAMSGDIKWSQAELIQMVKEQNPNYSGAYPNLIIYQGKEDPLVNFKNADVIVSQWAGVQKIDTIPDKIENSYMGIDDICRKEFQDANASVKIILYEVANLGHKLLIKPGDKDDEGGKSGSLAVEKGFHSTYQTAKEFGLIHTTDLEKQ